MATIKEIARQANVSIGTVDRVIHNRGKVKPAVEERIRRIMKELNYRPNVFARNLVLGKTFTFGVIMPQENQDSGYWRKSTLGIEQAASDLRSQRVAVKYFHFNKYSQGSFEKAADKALHSNLDGLLATPGPDKEFHQFAKNVGELPIVIFGTAMTDVPCISCIGQDAFQSGVVAGRMMHLLVQRESSIASIEIQSVDAHIDHRARGFASYFRDKGHIRIVEYYADGNGDAQHYQTLLEKILAENERVQGIFVTNVNTHKMAAQIEELNLVGQVHLIGYDLIEENIRYLRSGAVDFLISQRPSVQAYQGINALYRNVVLKEPVREKMNVQIDIVVKENIDYYQGNPEGG